MTWKYNHYIRSLGEHVQLYMRMYIFARLASKYNENPVMHAPARSAKPTVYSIDHIGKFI